MHYFSAHGKTVLHLSKRKSLQFLEKKKGFARKASGLDDGCKRLYGLAQIKRIFCMNRLNRIPMNPIKSVEFLTLMTV